MLVGLLFTSALQYFVPSSTVPAVAHALALKHHIVAGIIMFESYLTNLLSTHFGHLFTNISRDNVSISAWRGEVVLKDLGIRREALQVLLGGRDGADAAAGRNEDDDGYVDDSDDDDDIGDADCDDQMFLRTPTLASGESDIEMAEDGGRHDADSSNPATAKCPFQIEHGTIGTFELHIPWSVLRRRSATAANGSSSSGGAAGGGSDDPDNDRNENELSGCSLVLTDVNILITPTLDRHHNTEGRGKRRRERKQRRKDGATDADHTRNLDARRCRRESSVQELLQEVLLRQSVTSDSENISAAGGAEPKGDDEGGRRKAWIGSLTTSILSSLTVTVRNVHIRYEDPGSVPAFGTLSSFLPTNPQSLSRLNHPSMKSLRSLEETRGREENQHRPPFAVGIELESFLIKNTSMAPPKEGDLFQIKGDVGGRDESGTSGMRQDHPAHAISAHCARHKLASATDLSAYWDSGAELMCMRAEELRKRAKRRRPWDDHETKKSDVDKVASDVTRYYGSMFATIAKAGGAIVTDSRKNSNSIDSELPLEDFLPSPHTYVIQPMSASLHFTMISAGDDSTNNTNSSGADKADDVSSAQPGSSHGTESTCRAVVSTEGGRLPPSRAVLTIPSCHIVLARSTLEDIAYIRHSVSVWQHVKSGLLTETIFMQLTKLRPTRSVREDPRAWWLYASKAIRVMSQLSVNSKDGRQDSVVSASASTQSHRRWRKGWIGMAQMLACRRRYTALYEKFLSEDSSEQEKEECHRTLLELEDGLTSKEIVAFRMYLPSVLDEKSLQAIKGTTVVKKNVLDDDTGGRGGIISSVARKQAYDEMLLAISEVGWFFDSEEDNTGDSWTDGVDSVAHADGSHRTISSYLESKLEVAIIFPGLSLEALDDDARLTRKDPTSRSESRLRPIVRLVCTTVKRYKFYCNGSWEASSILSGLEVIDLFTPVSDESFGNFRLLGEKKVVEKHSTPTAATGVGSLSIGKNCLPLSGSISVRKVIELDSSTSGTIGSSPSRPMETTFVDARLAPLEAMYSTSIAQALSQFFDTAKTSEFAQDYQRMAVVVANWQQRQRERLMQALSEQEKRFCVNIDVSAPVLIIPQYLGRDKDCPALVIDLGRLTFVDTNRERSDLGDDTWKLTVSDIQVLSFASLKANRSEGDLGHPLVEPFGLDFAISTSFGSQSTRIGVRANMPRLVFNFTSSAVRLISRLRVQWDRTKQERVRSARPIIPTPTTIAESSIVHGVDNGSKPSGVATNQRKRFNSSRTAVVKFDFAAPFVAVSLSNDADDTTPVPLIFLVMRGISGHRTSNKVEGVSSKTVFAAKLKSLHAIDLYQRAGIEYSLLLSSQHPDPLYVKYPGDFTSGETRLCSGAVLDQWLESFVSEHEGVGNYDLVTISHEDVRTLAIDAPSHTSVAGAQEEDGSKLVVGFNELYVEWNPETIATMQTAMRLPIAERFDLLSQKLPTQTDLSDDHICTPDASFAGDDLKNDSDDANTSFSDDFYDALEYEDEIEEFHESRGIITPKPHGQKTDNVIFFTLPTDARGASEFM